MRKVFLLLLVVSTGRFCDGQSPIDTVKVKARAKEQAYSMAAFLVQKNYKGFVEYMHPKTIQDGGGKANIIGLLSRTMQKQEDKGFILTKTEIGEPGPIIRVPGQLQCTLPETLSLKVPGGTLVSMSTLVAVSMDGGKNWKFVDASGGDKAKLFTNYPTLSRKLSIPDYGEPVFTSD